jgi:hypothetical protein
MGVSIAMIVTVVTNAHGRASGTWKAMLLRLLSVPLLAAVVASCTSVGQVGMMTTPAGDVGSIIREARSYRELGPVEGQACRNFVLGIIPWGDSTASKAMENALAEVGGDAIINVSVETSLYGFLPIYNIFANTCTTVRGIAIKFDQS